MAQSGLRTSPSSQDSLRRHQGRTSLRFGDSLRMFRESFARGDGIDEGWFKETTAKISFIKNVYIFIIYIILIKINYKCNSKITKQNL